MKIELEFNDKDSALIQQAAKLELREPPAFVAYSAILRATRAMTMRRTHERGRERAALEVEA